MIDLKNEDITTPRTPIDLSRFVEETYNMIMCDDETRHGARLKRGLYKVFLEEVVLLSIYSSWKYRLNNVLCQPIIGNQGYDAIITNLPGSPEYKEYVEITNPFDGAQENEISKEINKKGIHSEVFDSNPFRQRQEAIDRILAKAHEKSLIDYEYNNSVLLFGLDLFPYFDLRKHEDKADIANLVQKLRQFKYKIRSVYLILLNAGNLSDQERILPVIDPSW